MRLEVRIGRVTPEQVFVRLWHKGGTSGEGLLDREALEAIAGPLELREGDFIALEVTPLSRTRPTSRRAT